MTTRHHRPLPAQRTEYRGIVYASRREATRAAELDLLVRAGKVAWWLRQVPVDLGEPGVDLPFRVDFLVAEWINFQEGVTIHAEDVKAVETREFARRKRQWRAKGPFELRILRGKTVEIIIPKRDDAKS